MSHVVKYLLVQHLPFTIHPIEHFVAILLLINQSSLSFLLLPLALDVQLVHDDVHVRVYVHGHDVHGCAHDDCGDDFLDARDGGHVNDHGCDRGDDHDVHDEHDLQLSVNALHPCVPSIQGEIPLHDVIRFVFPGELVHQCPYAISLHDGVQYVE